MTRYVARRPALWIDNWGGSMTALPSITVFEPQPEPRETGLLDMHGNPLVAYEDREPIGFHIRRNIT